jgi:hypothetical protein
LNACRIKKIDHHPAENYNDRAPETISDTEHWINWAGDLDNPNLRGDNWEAEEERD